MFWADAVLENVQDAFVEDNLTAQPFDFNATVAQMYDINCIKAVSTQDNLISENCLFLDVMISDMLFAKRTFR